MGAEPNPPALGQEVPDEDQLLRALAHRSAPYRRCG
jgi:hypothetical protein